MTPVVSSPRTSGSEGSYSRHFLHRIRPPSLRDFLDSDAGRRGPPKADLCGRRQVGLRPQRVAGRFARLQHQPRHVPSRARRICLRQRDRIRDGPGQQHIRVGRSRRQSRDGLSRENAPVEAGPFSADKLNQTLGSFPGIPSGLSGGGNETAYFSNDVGFYVKRVAYENGTPGAEMRLRSYSYGAGPPTGISTTQILLFIVLPIAVVVLVAVLLWRPRKDRIQGQASPPAPSATEGQELGGNDRAR